MEHIVEKIINYLKSANTDGAFHVKGEWGSGKTYFFKEILSDKIKEQVDRTQVMISLFGMESVKEIPFRLLNAYVNKKSEQKGVISEDMNRGLDYLDMKYGIDRKLFGMNLHDEEEMIYNIIAKDEVYLCFDDVERFVTEDNVGEMMGTLNNLVENMGYKVIVISNDHYWNKDVHAVSLFKEKVIGNTITFVPSVLEIYETVIDKYEDGAFSTFMKRDDVEELFLPQKRPRLYRKDFENIRNLKFAISNFYGIFNHYRDTFTELETIRSLKYYLAFIIGVSIEFKKDILKDEDSHGIEVDTDVFSINLGDDDDLRDVQELFSDYEETKDEKEIREKKESYDSVYRRRFYSVYSKAINQEAVFHEELYNSVTKGLPIDFEKLEDNLRKKIYYNEKAENIGNVIVAQTLDGSIFNYPNEDIKDKMRTLLGTVEDGSLITCAAYVNAFSFIDMYKSVIGKSHAELLEIFKSGIVKYISTHEIDKMEGTGLEMVAQDIPAKTKDFYDFLQQELHHKWTEKQSQGIEEMVEAFKTDVPKFCSMFSENEHGVTFHYITESVLHNIPEDLVAQRMPTLNPKDVHELAKLVKRRYIPQDIYSFHLQKEKSFVAAMKRGIEMIEGEDTVSKVEAKTVLLYQVDKALGNFEIAK